LLLQLKIRRVRQIRLARVLWHVIVVILLLYFIHGRTDSTSLFLLHHHRFVIEYDAMMLPVYSSLSNWMTFRFLFVFFSCDYKREIAGGFENCKL
jgi:hypothetical protein